MNIAAKFNNKTTDGFTIIELVSVIVVIGILATIGVMSFSGVQARSRDSQRSSSVNIIAESLEKYYEKNGEYPSCNDQSKIQDADLGSIDKSVLTAPGAASGVNSLVCDTTVNSGQFTYAKQSDGSWTLSYKSEVSGEIVSVKNRRQVSVAGNIPAGTTPTENKTTIETEIRLNGDADITIELGSEYVDWGARLFNKASDSPIADVSVTVQMDDIIENGYYTTSYSGRRYTNKVGVYRVIYGYGGWSAGYSQANDVTRIVRVVHERPTYWVVNDKSDKYINYGEIFNLEEYVYSHFIVFKDGDGQSGATVASSGDYIDSFYPGDYKIDIVGNELYVDPVYSSFWLHVGPPDYGYSGGNSTPECQWCVDNGYTPANGYSPTYDSSTGVWSMGDQW